MNNFISFGAGYHLLRNIAVSYHRETSSVLIGCPAYLGNGLVRPPPDSMRVDTKLPPHEVCRKTHLALLESIDVVLICSEVALAHQLGARVAGNFWERGPSLGPSSLVSASKRRYKIIGVMVLIIIFFVRSEIRSPSIGMEDMLETAGCEEIEYPSRGNFK